MRYVTISLAFMLTTGCGLFGKKGEAADAGDVINGIAGLELLGNGSGSVSSEDVVTDDEGLKAPRDVKINPDNGEIWVVNRKDESVVIMDADGNDTKFMGSAHFLARPVGLAFSPDNRTMATIHETDQPTQGAASPGDFMGPTMWDSDPSKTPIESQAFDHAGHLDMLHNSPLGMGIAAEKNNVYWVFDGAHSSLTRYNFKNDHGYGGADHSDAVTQRFVEGEVAMVDGVPSNMVFLDDELYVADPGNGRVAVLDTTTGSRGSTVSPNYDGGEQYAMDDADISTLVDDLDLPSGLAIHDNVIYVADNGTGTIYGYDLDGNLLDQATVDVSDGGLMGIDIDADGNLYYVDGFDNAVRMITLD
jgi:DNA-binding beta-propeller fold protein YncE